MVSAAPSQTATAPSAQELLGLLDEWNLSLFRSAFEEKKIDGYALMVCLLSVHNVSWNSAACTHNYGLINLYKLGRYVLICDI